MLRCSICKVDKTTAEFSPSTQARSGFSSHCKLCRRAHRKATMTYEKARDVFLRHKYRITLADYDAMVVAQNGKCGVCGEVPAPIYVKRNPKSSVFHVDHDHATGKVRGLLCYGCNCAMGFIRDRPERLGLLIGYLETHQT